MLGGETKSTIRLKCTEQAFSEFPNLLFGTQIESGTSYLDATNYLQHNAPEKSIKDFFIQYKTQIKALCDAYDISEDEVRKINEQGHYLIDGNFTYLFISFVDPNFLAYMCDRMHELMSRGIATSDTYLIHMVKARIPKEIINTIFEDDESK